MVKSLKMLALLFALGHVVNGQITLKQVNEAFEKAKLPTGEIVIFDSKTDPNKLIGRPNGYVEKANWKDATITDGDDAACTVEVFKNAAGAKSRKAYIDSLSGASPLFVQYLYLHRNVLVRIAKAVDPADAIKYEIALRGIK